MAEENLNAQYEERTFTLKAADGSGDSSKQFKYRLMKPAKIEPGKKYPIVLFLHGAGERGSDNEIQLKYLPQSMATAERREKYPCFVLAPQCEAGALWVKVAWSDEESTPMAEMATDQMQAVIGMLKETLANEPIDDSRVYLTGLSMGGYGSWYLGQRHPELFAAVAPVCGGGDETAGAQLKDMPVWAFHGDNDTAVPVDRSRRMIKAVEAAGGSPKYTEYPGMGHHSWIPAYDEKSGLLKWMFSQRREP